MIVTIEQHVDFIFTCLDFLKTSGFTTIEAEAELKLLGLRSAIALQGKPFSNVQLMVPRRQRPGKTENIHALCRRLPALSDHL